MSAAKINKERAQKAIMALDIFINDYAGILKAVIYDVLNPEDTKHTGALDALVKMVEDKKENTK
jgi:hypothetical protein